MKKMMLIVNPNAGRGGYKSTLADILGIFCSNDFMPTVFYTGHEEHAIQLIESFGADFDIIVCLGGDGTLSEVITGDMSLPKRLPIGYIPMGTANDVAKTLNLSNKPLVAAKAIAEGSVFPLDVGRFGPYNYFSYIAAFGAFTEVSYATNPDIKHALGQFAYMLEGMRSLTKINPYKTIVEYDNGVIYEDFIFGAVTNSTSIAGLVQINKDKVDLSDGILEVILVRPPADIFALNDIISNILTGTVSGENIVFIKSREVRFTFKTPVSFTRDGENGGKHRDICISCCHPGVDIVM